MAGRRYTGQDVVRFFWESLVKGRKHYDLRGKLLPTVGDILYALIWGGQLKSIQEPEPANDNRRVSMTGGIRTKESNPAYREGWDQTFRASQEWQVKAPCGTTISLGEDEAREMDDYSKPGGLDVRTEILAMKLQDHRRYCAKCIRLKK